jgi:hypothetical protein
MIEPRNEKEREYLAYIDEHISTVKNVWLALQERLNGLFWLEDWYYFIINDRIKCHDQSKYDGCEFDGYRQFFYPEKHNEKNAIVFNHAWNHHQKSNDHHWEYWLLIGTSGKIEALKMDLPSIIEMLCDWTAMSVKFKNMPSIWFNANKEKMVLHHDTFLTILHWLPLFDNIYSQMTAKVEA